MVITLGTDRMVGRIRKGRTLHSGGRWSSTVCSTVRVKTPMGAVRMIVPDIIVVLTTNTMTRRALSPKVVPKIGKKVLVMVSIVGGLAVQMRRQAACQAGKSSWMTSWAESLQPRRMLMLRTRSLPDSGGFGVRKRDVARVNGVLVRRDFFCYRQGTRHPKHYDRPERVREERLESRTDCKA
ncbi:hypothetical protein AHAS_Ahas20G0088000 [Arachis hypogaea]